MASTYVNDLRLNEMATGDASGSWGTVTNTNLELIGEAFSYGTETIGDADSTLTIADGAADAARSFYLKITSSVDLTTTRIVTLAPNTVSKVWMIENATTGSQVITIKQGSGATINVPNGQVKMLATDGAGSGGAVLDLLVDVDLTGTTTLVNLDVSGAVDIAGDLTLSAGGDGALRFTAASSVKVLDNNAAALVFEEADNAYMTFVTTDGSEAVKFDKALDINAATQIDATVTVGVDDTGYDVKFFGATTGKSLLWDESADSLIVTGSTSLQGGLEVGVDDTGYDVKFFGATAGAYMLWDESADDLILGGAAGLSVNSAATVGGTLGVTGVVTANAGVVVDNFTLDGTTLALSSGNMTLDSAGDIILDADGGNHVATFNDNGLSLKTDTARLLFTKADGTNIAFVGDLTGSGQGGAVYYNQGTAVIHLKSYEASQINTGMIFNENGADVDFRVESDTDANALFLQGSDGFIGVGTASPLTKIHINTTNVGNYTAFLMSQLGNTSGNTTELAFKFNSGGVSGGNISSSKDANAGSNLTFSTGSISNGADVQRLGISSLGGITATSVAGGHVVFNEDGVDADFRVESDTITHALFVQGSDGNVGIGASPSYKLHVSGTHLYLTNSGNTELMTTNTSGGTVTGGIQALTNQSVRVGSITDYPVEMVVNNSVKMTIDSGGGVRINNTADATFNAQLNIQSTSSKNCQLYLKVTDTSVTQSMIIFGNTTNDSVGSYYHKRISHSLCNTSSDYRLKTDAQPMTGASARVLALNPVNFAWIVDGSRVDGFLST
jgi:hypothetical protein